MAKHVTSGQVTSGDIFIGVVIVLALVDMILGLCFAVNSYKFIIREEQ